MVKRNPKLILPNEDPKLKLGISSKRPPEIIKGDTVIVHGISGKLSTGVKYKRGPLPPTEKKKDKSLATLMSNIRNLLKNINAIKKESSLNPSQVQIIQEVEKHLRIVLRLIQELGDNGKNIK